MHRPSSSHAVPEWCGMCGTRHETGGGCPGELQPREPERHGWRVTVETPHGIEAYGVLVASCGDVWRARILTYPNALWRAPRGGGAIKFVGTTPADAEGQAAAFIRAHCRANGFVPHAAAVDVPSAALPGETVTRSPAARKLRFVPVHYGEGRPAHVARTANLSESGLFIITPRPVDPGRRLAITITLHRDLWLELDGQVVWRRFDAVIGRVAGMGVRLPRPPDVYVEHVRSLP